MNITIVFQFVFFLTYIIIGSNGSRRFKRQILPNDKIKVFSMFSNVSLADNIIVDSVQSRINVTENIGNIVVFSDISKLSFPTNCLSFNLSLQNQGTFLNISNIKLAALSNLAFISEESKKISNSEETTVIGTFNNNVNLKVDDGQTLFQAINGTAGNLNILTRKLSPTSPQENDSPTISLKANHSTTNNDKTLYIESETTSYEIMASISGANIGITFDGLSVLLYNNYNRLTIFSNSYVFDVNAELSNFSMKLSKDLFAVYTSDNVVTIVYDLKNRVIKLIIQQPSDTGITLGGGTVEGNNSMFGKAFDNELYINSSAIQITGLDDGSKFLFNANKSQLQFGCENNAISLVSNMHEFQINNGSPNITIKLKALNFIIAISPKVNDTVPSWLYKDNFNESQFGNLSSALDSIISNINDSNLSKNEEYVNTVVDEDGTHIKIGQVTNLPSIINNSLINQTTNQENNQSGLTTNSFSNEVTLMPNFEIPLTKNSPLTTTSITYVTPNLMPLTSKVPNFQTFVPSNVQNNQITTWQSTFDEERNFKDFDFAVFQYNTEPSRNDKIAITATIASVDFKKNDTNIYTTSQEAIILDNNTLNAQNEQLSFTNTVSFAENMTTPISMTSTTTFLTESNDFPTPSPLIRSRYYNLFRKTRNIISGENTYNAILKKKN